MRPTISSEPTACMRTTRSDTCGAIVPLCRSVFEAKRKKVCEASGQNLSGTASGWNSQSVNTASGRNSKWVEWVERQVGGIKQQVGGVGGTASGWNGK